MLLYLERVLRDISTTTLPVISGPHCSNIVVGSWIKSHKWHMPIPHWRYQWKAPLHPLPLTNVMTGIQVSGFGLLFYLQQREKPWLNRFLVIEKLGKVWVAQKAQKEGQSCLDVISNISFETWESYQLTVWTKAPLNTCSQSLLISSKWVHSKCQQKQSLLDGRSGLWHSQVV